MSLWAAVLLAAPCAASDAPAGQRVQVAIVRQAASVKLLVADGDADLVLPGGRVKPLEWKGELTLRPREGGLRLANTALPSETRLVPRGGAIKVGGHRYRGPFILRLDPGQTVTVIEEPDIESYLEGVLPHEMDPDWPLEALKAQAVVARTFTYANIGKFRKEGFDLTNDTRSQVYRGLALVNENVRSAVRQTRGEVLGWKGKLLPVYYHACCGGQTTDASSPWGADKNDTPAPLRGVRDPWCKASPHVSWTAYFAWDDLMNAADGVAPLPGPMKALKIGRKDLAGYVMSFVASTTGDPVSLRATDFRARLGAGDLRSLKIRRILARRKGLEFHGGGSGHGVGLCQWGARLQSEKGRSYEKILLFYFPGAELSEVDE
ncbi:MAG: SpoIID/LytB domain-containing protein [Elusimicrobiota bacterium]|nr:SpoIID/LytB domain-containing protein [Elusimicrobiota bacterium]